MVHQPSSVARGGGQTSRGHRREGGRCGECATHHLSQPDPYLDAAVCGWSSSNTRVLRQEETADGPQQALGRHLGHLAGAE